MVTEHRGLSHKPWCYDIFTILRDWPRTIQDLDFMCCLKFLCLGDEMFSGHDLSADVKTERTTNSLALKDNDALYKQVTVLFL